MHTELVLQVYKQLRQGWHRGRQEASETARRGWQFREQRWREKISGKPQRRKCGQPSLPILRRKRTALRPSS